MSKRPTISDFPPHLKAQIAKQLGGDIARANHGWGNQPPPEKKKVHTPDTGNKWKKVRETEQISHNSPVTEQTSATDQENRIVAKKAHLVAKNVQESAKNAQTCAENARVGVKKYIGIDSGTHTGIAIWNKSAKKFELIRTVKIHVAMEIVLAEFNADPNILVRVEDARQRKWIANDHSKGDAKAQGAGSIKRDATIWEDFLTDHGIPHEMIPPQVGDTKLTKEHFGKITGYTGLTSNHGRDAGMIVFNY